MFSSFPSFFFSFPSSLLSPPISVYTCWRSFSRCFRTYLRFPSLTFLAFSLPFLHILHTRILLAPAFVFFLLEISDFSFSSIFLSLGLHRYFFVLRWFESRFFAAIGIWAIFSKRRLGWLSGVIEDFALFLDTASRVDRLTGCLCSAVCKCHRNKLHYRVRLSVLLPSMSSFCVLSASEVSASVSVNDIPSFWPSSPQPPFPPPMAILPPSPPQVVFLFLVAVPHQKLPERLRPPLKESKKERHRRQFEEKVRLEDAARELKKRFMKWKKNQEEGTNEQARLNGNLCRGRLGRGSNKLGRGSNDCQTGV